MGCGAVQCSAGAEQSRMAKVGHPSSVFLAIASSRHRHLGSIFEPISNLPALSPSVPPSLPPQILFLPSLSFPRPQLPPPRARTRSVPSSLSLSPSLFLHSLDGWSIGHMRGRGALRARETASRRVMYRLTTTLAPLPGPAWPGLAWSAPVYLINPELRCISTSAWSRAFHRIPFFR